MHAQGGGSPGDAVVLQDEPLLDDDLTLGNKLFLNDIFKGPRNHSSGFGEPLGYKDSGMAIANLALGHHRDPLAPGSSFEDQQGL